MMTHESEVLKLAVYKVEDTVIPADLRISEEDAALATREIRRCDFQFERTVS